MAFLHGNFLFNIGVLIELIPESERFDFSKLNTMVKYEGEAEYSFENYRTKQVEVVKVKVNGFLKKENAVEILLNSSEHELTDTNYFLCKYSSEEFSEEGRSSYSFSYPLKLQKPLSWDYVTQNIFLEFNEFIFWIIHNKSIDNLSNSTRIAAFLKLVITNSPEICMENGDVLEAFAELVLRYFDKVGIDCLFKELGVKNAPVLVVDLQEEEFLESDINGRSWFNLDGLANLWAKYSVSKSDILHFAETGKLQISFDWVSTFIRNQEHYFQYDYERQECMSRLIEFEKAPLSKTRLHSYKLSINSNSKYCRLATISTYDIKDFITRGEIKSPYCTVNNFKLTYRKNYNAHDTSDALKDVVLKENQLIVTTREIRLFEENILGLKINRVNKSKTYSSEKTITPAQENSHLRVIGALLKTIEERATKPFTLEVLKFELEEKYSKEMGIKGFSKSSLDTLFANANKALRDK